MVSSDKIKELREKTGVGMMDCKKALDESNGDFEKAVDLLRKKGLAAVAKKQSRIAAEGAVGSYIHFGGKLGVMVEVNCETDFVAKNEAFTNLVKDIAMQIAAADPKFIRAEEMDEEFVKREKEIYAAQLKEQGKPENMIAKILEGKVKKLAEEVCLYNQKFVKDPDKTIQDLINEITLKVGEKITVRRFVKYVLGEGLAKRNDDLAKEIEKLTANK